MLAICNRMRKWNMTVQGFSVGAADLLKVAGFLAATLLGACATAETAAPPAAISTAEVGNICANEMAFDVTGPYYANCRNYLLRHARAQLVLAAAAVSEPAEHKACLRIGLAKGSPDYGACVQEMYQLDLGSQHL